MCSGCLISTDNLFTIPIWRSVWTALGEVRIWNGNPPELMHISWKKVSRVSFLATVSLKKINKLKLNQYYGNLCFTVFRATGTVLWRLWSQRRCGTLREVPSCDLSLPSPRQRRGRRWKPRVAESFPLIRRSNAASLPFSSAPGCTAGPLSGL